MKEPENVGHLYDSPIESNFFQSAPDTWGVLPRSNIYTFLFFIFFHNGGYWLTDPFPGFRRWARRLPLEPQWEPSWQLLSIRPSSTPSSKATREVSIPRVCHSAGRAPVTGSAALVKLPLTHPSLAAAAIGFDPTGTAVLILSLRVFLLLSVDFPAFNVWIYGLPKLPTFENMYLTSGINKRGNYWGKKNRFRHH